MQTRFAIVAILTAVLLNGGVVASVADDSTEQAIKRDRKLYQGLWRAVSLVVNGNKGGNEDTKRITVVNGLNNKWILQRDGQEFANGTNSLDPTKRLREIDILPSEGDIPHEVHLGIYEIEENTRKLCLAPPGKPRPTAFESSPGSEHTLIVFERAKSIEAGGDSAKAEGIKKDRRQLQGTWSFVSVIHFGTKQDIDDFESFKVVNGADNTWALVENGKPAIKGTNALDPTRYPRWIDVWSFEGDDPPEVQLGIYEINGNTRRLCLATGGNDRPTEFTSTRANAQTLITFQRKTDD